MEWSSGLGARVVGTLPLLPSFLDEPFEPSPYSPMSRLFWNEFFVDVTRIPEFAQISGTHAKFASADFHAEVAAFRQAPLVDYRAQMRLKRGVLGRGLWPIYLGTEAPKETGPGVNYRGPGVFPEGGRRPRRPPPRSCP
jgi:4-alpha-glucanotransferase